MPSTDTREPETPENVLARAMLSFHACMDRWEVDIADKGPPPDAWKFAAEWVPDIVTALRSPAERGEGERWTRTVDRLPPNEVPVIAYYCNEYGKDRVIRAMHVDALTLEATEAWDDCEYDEGTDTYYCPEGWYENNEAEETHWQVEGEVTHWMPLPASPALASPPAPGFDGPLSSGSGSSKDTPAPVEGTREDRHEQLVERLGPVIRRSIGSALREAHTEQVVHDVAAALAALPVKGEREEREPATPEEFWAIDRLVRYWEVENSGGDEEALRSARVVREFLARQIGIASPAPSASEEP